MTERTLYAGVAARIRELREGARLTQHELAAKASLNPFYMVRVESGELNLSLQTIGRVALALDVSPAALFEGVVAEPALLEVKERVNARRRAGVASHEISPLKSGPGGSIDGRD